MAANDAAPLPEYVEEAIEALKSAVYWTVTTDTGQVMDAHKALRTAIRRYAEEAARGALCEDCGHAWADHARGTGCGWDCECPLPAPASTPDPRPAGCGCPVERDALALDFHNACDVGRRADARADAADAEVARLTAELHARNVRLVELVNDEEAAEAALDALRGHVEALLFRPTEENKEAARRALASSERGAPPQGGETP